MAFPRLLPKLAAVTLTAAALVTGAAPSASAANDVMNGFMTGNALYKACQEGDAGNYGQKGICIGYIEGFSDALASAADSFGRKQCPADSRGIAGAQIGEIVVKYLKTHPEERQFLASNLIARAIAEAFHCDWAAVAAQPGGVTAPAEGR